MGLTDAGYAVDWVGSGERAQEVPSCWPVCVPLAAPLASGHNGRAGRAFLEVEDDGPGIAAAQRQQVLQRFYRVQGSPGEGNGLGLAIADEIARVHHGHLQMGSGSGERGLKVTLLLPESATAGPPSAGRAVPD